MARRPVNIKRARRVYKALARQPLPAFIDPVAWVLDHGHAATKREARTLILAGRLRADSHTVGIEDGYERVSAGIGGDILKPAKVVGRVPSAMRSSLVVTSV